MATIDEQLMALSTASEGMDGDTKTQVYTLGLLEMIARDCRRIADATEQETKQSAGGGPR